MRRETYLEVDLNNFEDNLISTVKYANPKEVLPIIKANAYGIGVQSIIGILNRNNISLVCVALVSEGIELKKYGYNGKILILNPCLTDELEDVVKYELVLGSCDENEIVKLNEIAKENNKILDVHLEIEAGIHRPGIAISNLQQYLDVCGKLKNININGIYTYFVGNEKDKKYIQYQLDTLKDAIKILDNNNIKPKYIHMANLNIISDIQIENCITAIRIGMDLYGHNPIQGLQKDIQMKPVSKLVSCVSFLKEIDKDTSVGYGRAHIAKEKEKIATIPIGYADGYPRNLSNKGKVVINNQVCNLVGSVCMDSILVDVTKIDNIKIGDKVYIWDNDKITVNDIAKLSNTIDYETISRISPRVERKYV